MSTWAEVQSGNAANPAAAATNSMAFVPGSNVAAGDLFVLAVATGGQWGGFYQVWDSAGNGGPSGYKLLAPPSITEAPQIMLFGVYVATGGPFTVFVEGGANGDYPGVAYAEYSYPGLTGISISVAPASAAQQTANESVSSGNLTTTATSLLLGPCAINAIATVTPGSGWTLRANAPGAAGQNYQASLLDQLNATAGTYAANASLSSSEKWASQCVSINPLTTAANVSTVISNYDPISQDNFANVAANASISGRQLVYGGGPWTTIDGAYEGDGAGGLFLSAVTSSVGQMYAADVAPPGWDQSVALTFKAVSNAGNAVFVASHYNPATGYQVRYRYNPASNNLTITPILAAGGSTVATSGTVAALTAADTYLLWGRYTNGIFFVGLYNVTTGAVAGSASYLWAETTLDVLTNGYCGFGALTGGSPESSTTGYHPLAWEANYSPRSLVIMKGATELTTALSNGITYGGGGAQGTGIPTLTMDAENLYVLYQGYQATTDDSDIILQTVPRSSVSAGSAWGSASAPVVVGVGVSGTAGTQAGSAAIAVDPVSGTLVFVYLYIDTENNQRLFVRTSANQGSAWSSPTEITSQFSAYDNPLPANGNEMLALANGTVVMAVGYFPASGETTAYQTYLYTTSAASSYETWAQGSQIGGSGDSNECQIAPLSGGGILAKLRSTAGNAELYTGASPTATFTQLSAGYPWPYDLPITTGLATDPSDGIVVYSGPFDTSGFRQHGRLWWGNAAATSWSNPYFGNSVCGWPAGAILDNTNWAENSNTGGFDYSAQKADGYGHFWCLYARTWPSVADPPSDIYTIALAVITRTYLGAPAAPTVVSSLDRSTFRPIGYSPKPSPAWYE
jgi:hypothetical protein